MTRKAKLTLTVALPLVIAGFVLLSACFDFALSRDWEGAYLLRGTDGQLVFSNSLYLGEEDRCLLGIDLFVRSLPTAPAALQPRLTLDWNAEAGVGYLRNDLGDGTILVTNFSRFIDSYGRRPHGLFIGGALPASLHQNNAEHLNDSGMTWFDGREWNHIWCNTNEGISSATRREGAAPTQWTFLDSRVLEQSSARVVISSRHQVTLDQVPFQIERVMTGEAGRPYLQLEIRISNRGERPGSYNYYYGDEPWLGDFGSSAGDIGWLADRLITSEEQVDPLLHSHAGMVDAGNDLIHEGHNFRHVANFIEWSGPDRPDTVFFANKYFGFDHDPALHFPLFGNTRSLGMYWFARTLAPGESRVMTLVIGMAQRDLHSGIPHKPPVALHPRLASLAATDDSRL